MLKIFKISFIRHPGKTCKYDGKEYKIGEYIQPKKPCRSCICTEKWTDEDGPGCSDVDCLAGIYAGKIRSGCIPIYFESKCCLSETYCGKFLIEIYNLI